MLVDDELGLYVVSDGMGGHNGGDVASRHAVAVVAEYVREQRPLIKRIHQGLVNETLLSSLAARAVKEACRAVYQRAKVDPTLIGMGCTLTVLLLGVHKAAMAHVGDSRLYLYRNDRVRQLSVDHSLAQELVRSGAISQSDADSMPNRNSLTRAVGVMETVIVDELLIPVNPGDRFLLCSDGLWDYLSDITELEAYLAVQELDVSARSLIDLANDAGGYDNITALVVQVDDRDSVDDDDFTDSEETGSGYSTTLKLAQVDSSAEIAIY